MNFEIPEGLGDILKDFTVSILRERPLNIYDFAVEYFTRVRESKRSRNVPMYIIVDSDEEAGEPDKSTFKPKTSKNRYARRSSVSAERYNPEEDDDDDEKVVFPKTDQERKRLMEAVSGILFFKCLDSDQIQDVLDAMFKRDIQPGEHVIEQGDDGDNFYVIDSGIYDVLVTTNGQQKKVHQFEEKGSFGELALMYNMPRSATVLALTEGTLWAMDRNSFRKIVLKSAFKKRKMYEGLLENVPMLESLDEYERMNLADALMPQTFEENTCIIKEGDDASGMFFIEDGIVRVTIHKDGTETEVARAGKGKYFGEKALLENAPRSASVYSLTKVKLAFLERDSFERLLGSCLDIMKRTMKKYQNSTGNYK